MRRLVRTRTRFMSRRRSPTTTAAARSRTDGAWAAGRARRWGRTMNWSGTSAGRATTGAGRMGRRSARRGTSGCRTSRCARRRGRRLPNPSPPSRMRNRSSRPRSRSWSLGRSGRRVRHRPGAVVEAGTGGRPTRARARVALIRARVLDRHQGKNGKGRGATGESVQCAAS